MDKAIYTKQEVKDLVKQYKRRLKQKGLSFDSVYLFGSYARGLSRPWSDIDVAVISSRFGKDPIKEGVKLDELADELSLAIEPHPLNTKDFREGILPVAEEIKQHGIKI